MITVNLRELAEIIRMAIINKQSVIALGSPGVGKTEIMGAIALERGISILIHDAPGLDPTDVRGVLIPDKSGKSHFTKSALLPDPAKHGEDGILLIDEITSAMPSVQVAFHPLFHPQERRLGNDRLADGWIPMATGNYATDGAGAMGLLSALSDRANIINVVSDWKIWKEDYAIPKGLHPITIGLINFRNDLLNTFDKRAKGEKGKQFASERSHTQVSKILYYAETHEISASALYAGVSGYVGEGVASEYMAFRKLYLDLPNPIDILVKGKNIIPDEPSVLYALCSSIVHHIGSVDMPIQKAIDRMLEYSLKIDAEFGMLLVRDAYVKYRANIIRSPHWQVVGERYL